MKLKSIPNQLRIGEAHVPDSLRSPSGRRTSRLCLQQGDGDRRAAPAPDLATPAGLSHTLTSKLGISEAQASQALGAVLGEAKGQLSPEDYAKLAGAIPGADNYLSAAADAGIGAP